MKSRINMALLVERVARMAPAMGGVFSSSDLANLIEAGSDLKNSRTIQRLVREGILFRVQRGIYTTKTPDLWLLAARLNEACYISMDSVLARNGLIGTVPDRSVSAVQPARNRVLDVPGGSINFYSISRNLMFGCRRSNNGVAVADSEKAFLDLLYYYTKGARFVVDPLTEVNLERLDRTKIKRYLKAYMNPKFVKFVRGQFTRGVLL